VSLKQAESIPMVVRWREGSGQEVQERADAIELSTAGAVLEMEKFPPTGTRIILIDAQSNRIVRARVIRAFPERQIFSVVAAIEAVEEAHEEK
jgi:hypothetical protein